MLVLKEKGTKTKQIIIIKIMKKKNLILPNYVDKITKPIKTINQ